MPKQRKLNANKPATSKRATDKPARVLPVIKPETTVAAETTVENKPRASIVRDATTIAGMRYPANTQTARDESFLAFYALLGCDKQAVSLADIAAKHRINPLKNAGGKNKSTDCGAAERAVKFGFAEFDTANRTIKLTQRGAELARNIIKRDGHTLPTAS
jgi:hypothetical protein